MSTFIESAACRGCRPVSLVASIHHSRTDLLTKLVRERHVARFLIAPDGFGKTSLAYEYAQIMFSFKHVFWVRGSSPCFLRDLDARALGPGIREAEESASLVVFEDVPHLDQDRSELFNELLEDLLTQGCEVLVTCAPSCDSLGSRHLGRQAIRPRDFLLSEEEARVTLRGEHPGDDLGAVVKPAERIACLRWGGEGARGIAVGLSKELLPSEMLLAMFVMALFGRGDLVDVLSVLPVSRKRLDELALEVEEGYPYLGVATDEGVFDAADFDAESLKVAFGHSMDGLVRSSAFDSKEMLIARLADELVARGSFERAVEFVLVFATKAGVGAWLSQRGWNLVGAGSALPVRELFDVVSSGSAKKRHSCNVIAAWASHLLNDPANAISLARRSMSRSSLSVSERKIACVLLMRDPSAEHVDQARGVLEQLVRGSEPSEGSLAQGQDDCCDLGLGQVDSFADAGLLAELALAFGRGVLHGAGRWAHALASYESELERGRVAAVENALLLSASWLFEALASEERAKFALSLGGKELASILELGIDPEAVAMSAASFSVEALERSCHFGRRMSWCCFAAMRQLETAAGYLPVLASYRPSPRAISHLSRYESFIQRQRDELRKLCAERDRRMDEYYEAHPNLFRDDARTMHVTNSNAKAVVPTMHVSLFGGFEVRMGGEVLASSDLKKRKVRALLAILVISRGKEVSRDRLAEMIWPHSTLEAARKNLYTTWAILERALSRNGACPYLVRNQQGWKVNSQLVVSDVSEFDSICRSLMVNLREGQDWMQLCSRLDESFLDDLMPCEASLEYIVSMRNRYRSQLVEALHTAAQRLVEAGESRSALWFAREALGRDGTREDSYAVLMEAQIAAGQRGPAAETFHDCRRMLSEEFGIDPSPQLIALYNKIIEVDEVFV